MTALNSGQIVVPEDFGWSSSQASHGGGAGSLGTDIDNTETFHSGEQNFDDAKTRMVGAMKAGEAMELVSL